MALTAILVILFVLIYNFKFFVGFYYSKANNSAEVDTINNVCEIKIPKESNVEKLFLLKSGMTREGFLYSKVIIPAEKINELFPGFNLQNLNDSQLSSDEKYIIEPVNETDGFYDRYDMWKNDIHHKIQFAVMSKDFHLKIFVTEKVDNKVILYMEQYIFDESLTHLQRKYIFRKWL